MKAETLGTCVVHDLAGPHKSRSSCVDWRPAEPAPVQPTPPKCPTCGSTDKNSNPKLTTGAFCADEFHYKCPTVQLQAEPMGAEQFWFPWVIKAFPEWNSAKSLSKRMALRFAEAYAAHVLSLKLAEKEKEIERLSQDFQSWLEKFESGELDSEQLKDAEAERDSLRQERDTADAKARLDQFYRMKKERPIDPSYWDMHEERRLKDAVAEAERLIGAKK